VIQSSESAVEPSLSDVTADYCAMTGISRLLLSPLFLSACFCQNDNSLTCTKLFRSNCRCTDGWLLQTTKAFTAVTVSPHNWPNSQCLDVKNYEWRLNPVWHRMRYSCMPMWQQWASKG